MSLFPDLQIVLSSEDSACILTPGKVFGKMGCALLQFIVILVAVLFCFVCLLSFLFVCCWLLAGEAGGASDISDFFLGGGGGGGSLRYFRFILVGGGGGRAASDILDLF